MRLLLIKRLSSNAHIPARLAIGFAILMKTCAAIELPEILFDLLVMDVDEQHFHTTNRNAINSERLVPGDSVASPAQEVCGPWTRMEVFDAVEPGIAAVIVGLVHLDIALVGAERSA